MQTKLEKTETSTIEPFQRSSQNQARSNGTKQSSPGHQDSAPDLGLQIQLEPRILSEEIKVKLIEIEIQVCI